MQAAELSRNDLALEVGPGIGVLTQQLVEQAGWVIAVELDQHLVPLLQDQGST